MQQVQLGSDGEGKIRDFAAGLGLTIVTAGLYELWWYYRLNEELRAVGRLTNDQQLSRSLPALSSVAVGLAWIASAALGGATLGFVVGMVFLAVSLISQYRFGKRLLRAQELVGIPDGARFRSAAFLLLFPGNLLVIPPIFWFAHVTTHQNAVLRAAAASPSARVATFAGLPG